MPTIFELKVKFESIKVRAGTRLLAGRREFVEYSTEYMSGVKDLKRIVFDPGIELTLFVKPDILIPNV